MLKETINTWALHCVEVSSYIRTNYNVSEPCEKDYNKGVTQIIHLADKTETVKLINEFAKKGYTVEIREDNRVFVYRISFSYKLRVKYTIGLRIGSVDGVITAKLSCYKVFQRNKYNKYTQADSVLKGESL